MIFCLSDSFTLSPTVHGVVDLVRLPYHQYHEDGRIVWGLQQGASSFSTSTGVAVVELTSRTLETLQVHTMLSHYVSLLVALLFVLSV